MDGIHLAEDGMRGKTEKAFLPLSNQRVNTAANHSGALHNHIIERQSGSARLGQEAYIWKRPAQRTVSFKPCIEDNTSASPTPHYSDLSPSLPPSHSRSPNLCFFIFVLLPRQHRQTHTRACKDVHTPILITAILIVQEMEAIAFSSYFHHPCALPALGLL